MFSKISRYRKLPDITTLDLKGRTLVSKPIRLLPEVEGKFLHTVEEIDRPDHLGFKYYKQPGKWWQICDANPDFMSPLALLGKEPMVTTQFTLIFQGGKPPWAELIKDLSQLTGIENFHIIDEIQIVPEIKRNLGVSETFYYEQFQRSVIITHNTMNVSTESLCEIIQSVGFEATEPKIIGRTGKKIVIPPNTIG
jgi:hypothetical protein